MKRSFTLGIVFAFLLSAAATAQPAARTPGPNPRFYEVQKKLDRGGSFYLYMDLKGVFANLASGIDGIVDQVAAEASPQERAQMDEFQKAIQVVLHYSSLGSVEDFGMSVVPDGDLNRAKIFIRMPGEAKGLRTALGGKPSPRRLVHLVPSSTVLFYDSDFSLAALYSVIESAWREATPPEQKDQLNIALSRVERMSQLPLRKILAGLDGEMGVALSFDDSGNATVPGPGGRAVQIPKPALILALQTRDSLLYDSLHQLLTRAGLNPTTLTLGQGARGFMIPVPPLGFPLLPTVAYKKPFFLFSTDPRLLTDGLKNMAEGKGGLADEKDFVDTLKDLPRVNNGLFYTSRRFYQVVGNYLGGAAPNLGPFAEALKSARKSTAGVRLNDPDGLLFISRTESRGGQIVAIGLAAPLGVMTAIAVPGFIRAREVSRRNQCQENLVKIDAAKSAWALENNKKGSDVPTWGDLVKPNGTGYLRSIPHCPSGGTYTIGPVDENPSCSYQQGEFPHVFPRSASSR